MELLIYFLSSLSTFCSMSDNFNDLLMNLQGPVGGGKSLFDSPMGGGG